MSCVKASNFPDFPIEENEASWADGRIGFASRIGSVGYDFSCIISDLKESNAFQKKEGFGNSKYSSLSCARDFELQSTLT